MNRDNLNIAFRFLLLLTLQIIVVNNIRFFGYINPHIYLLFVFLYPLQEKRSNFLILSFLLGLCVDIFSNSGGINAAATVFVAYIRLNVLIIILNKYDLDYKLFKLGKEQFIKILLFVSALTFTHHFIVYYLDYFSMQKFGTVLAKSAANSIFTIIICLLSITIFTPKKHYN